MTHTPDTALEQQKTDIDVRQLVQYGGFGLGTAGKNWLHSLTPKRFANSRRKLLTRVVPTGYVGIALSIASCGGGADMAPVGSCDVHVNEPVLTLSAASNSTNSAAINEIRLTDVKFNGIAANAAAIIASSKNLRSEGEVLACTLPCAFGSDDYRITMTISAPGFQSKTIAVDASYASKTSGCPSTLSNGTKIDIILDPL